MHKESAGYIAVHSPPTSQMQTTDGTDDGEKPVATGQEGTQCRGRGIECWCRREDSNSTGR